MYGCTWKYGGSGSGSGTVVGWLSFIFFACVSGRVFKEKRLRNFFLREDISFIFVYVLGSTHMRLNRIGLKNRREEG